MHDAINFPNRLISSDRWMVSVKPNGKNASKQPLSVYEEEPEGYEGPAWFRTRWADPVQWASFTDALSYASDNEDVTNLCFVLRTESNGEQDRFICFDFDDCFLEDGTLDPAVADVLAELGTWVEYSKNGKGLHAFGMYNGVAIKTENQVPIGSSVCDIITSGQVVCTGKPYADYGDKWNGNIRLADFEFVSAKPKADKDLGDCWSVECSLSDGRRQRLADDMATWETCCRSKFGSSLGSGGDVEMFRAACHLARHGATSDIAVELLKLVPVDPVPFTDQELAHKVKSAYQHVSGEGEFGAYGDASIEFDAVSSKEDKPEDKTAKVRGFEGLELREHIEKFSMDTMPAFIVKDLLFEQGALMIGGQNKTFKTSVGLDLLLSVATLKPFLSQFPIECEAKSVAVFSSETCEWMMTKYIKTIMSSKGIDVGDVKKSFTINSNVPSFSMNQNGEMKRNGTFEKYMSKHKPDVVFFDPLYRMFSGVNQADISAMGQALEYVEDICKDSGSMPIFCHHSRKPNSAAGVDFPIMTLNDLSGAGGGAFTRQWMLLSHTQAYVSGSARLHCYVGASGSDSKEWAIDLETMEGPEDNRRMVWKPRAYALNTDAEVLHRLSREGKSTIAKLAKALKKSEHEIRKVADKLDVKGVVSFVNNSIELTSNLSGEVDF